MFCGITLMAGIAATFTPHTSFCTSNNACNCNGLPYSYVALASSHKCMSCVDDAHYVQSKPDSNLQLGTEKHSRFQWHCSERKQTDLLDLLNHKEWLALTQYLTVGAKEALSEYAVQIEHMIEFTSQGVDVWIEIT
jgi:hypothetical protein